MFSSKTGQTLFYGRWYHCRPGIKWDASQVQHVFLNDNINHNHTYAFYLYNYLLIKHILWTDGTIVWKISSIHLLLLIKRFTIIINSPSISWDVYSKVYKWRHMFIPSSSTHRYLDPYISLQHCANDWALTSTQCGMGRFRCLLLEITRCWFCIEFPVNWCSLQNIYMVSSFVLFVLLYTLFFCATI